MQELVDLFTPENPVPAFSTPQPQGLLSRMVNLVSSPFRASSPTSEEETSLAENRPRRTVSQTRLYQSEEEAQKEKELKSKPKN